MSLEYFPFYLDLMGSVSKYKKIESVKKIEKLGEQIFCTLVA